MDLISFKHLVKVYPPDVVALDNVSTGFHKGEIHAVVGENGAGKSTLMKVLYGLTARDSGEIYYLGHQIDFNTPREAIAAGIGMVHQDFVLIPEYSVWENIVLGVEPVGSFDKLDSRQARRRVQEKIDEYRFNLNPDARVGDISVAARQKVEILKLLYREVSVLILDEPTAVLTPHEVPGLFSELEHLRDNGRTIIFISHRLDEVLDLSDRVTVMRKGKVINTVNTSETNKQELAHMMVGRNVIFSSRRLPQTPGRTIFRADGLNYKDSEGRPRLVDVSFEVRSGEIVGVAGVEGNGQFELVNIITGLRKPLNGVLTIDGQELSEEPILERRRLLSYVPQDRGKMGSSLNASILENAIMTHHRLDARFSTWKGLMLNWNFARRFTNRLQGEFSVKMSSPYQPLKSLSGGNQQKLILGRELLLDTPLVLLDQPTRGLDVGSIEYVHEQILRMRAQGKALLLISADLEELLILADRILVLYRGHIVANLPVEQTSKEKIGFFMLEGKELPA